MLRVAGEVRVFPLLTAFAGVLSPHLVPILQWLRKNGYKAEIRKVAYEFQKGGNQMLVTSS